MNTTTKRCAIIGAGPAGLTAALELARAGIEPLVFEMDQQVGGISRTAEYKGYRFDIGGHRFFTKVDRVFDWWMEILGDEFLLRPRLSRIYYSDKFFDYPLKPAGALKGLGIVESGLIGLSYLKAQMFPHPEETNLEQWVTNRFGKRLYSMFFKTYTEKVWGMKCTEIGADWAAQRIKNLDLRKAVLSMLAPPGKSKKDQITSLIEEFHYPKYGPGQLWERVAEILGNMGHPVRLGMRVTKIHGADQRITGVTTTDSAGNYETFDVDHVLSSMPIKELFGILEVPAPAEAIRAADDLRYRDFLTVALIIRKANLFPDNWIYIHSPKVKVGRIQNFGNWSPYLVPDEGHSCLGLEYFVQEGDEEWTSTDAELIEQGKREAALLGLIDSADVLDGVVIRMPKAYPVYDKGYKDRLQVIQRFIDSIENLQFIGRNGQHRYNNQDHSMMTAFFAAENVLGAQHDVWNVNVDGEYHEVDEKKSVSTSGDRMVPESATRSPAGIFASAFAKYDPVALGAALGSISGIAVFLATAALLLRGGENVGRTLSLLANYLIGFEVTWVGAVIGLLWATGGGFAIGACMAFAINLTVSRHLAKLYRSLGVVVTPE